jgi:hypothetical protein
MSTMPIRLTEISGIDLRANFAVPNPLKFGEHTRGYAKPQFKSEGGAVCHLCRDSLSLDSG